MGAAYTPDPTVKQRAVDATRAEAIERLALVARLRASLDATDAEVETQERAFFASIQPLTDRQHELKAHLVIAEQEARALALDLYTADPSSKTPVPGASIKVRRGVRYDAEVAFTWASAKGLFIRPPSLDVKSFETFLLSEPKTPGLGYEITETPTVAIDKTLPTPEPTA